ncbi:4Fe-4S dicluster domain-containing protein [Mycolicibacterium porcinum]|uniref:FAD-dependent oxidoreductase n=1 Tax=Mycolicibacterium porcinum TaxID=39693 RepID=UPI001195C4B5|nr:FAD-dependent oxidoreductase [Mycolicibacterium porcinum]TVX95998.1 4Fe-4S dicluster domain-containing protein [Mycolicibacterium porcinum]
MTFVITQNCCADAACVPVCPVDCIRPAPQSAESPAQSLYIDPASCVDCGACQEVCPVDAIYHEDELPPTQLPFLDINANYFKAHPLKVREFGSRPPKESVTPGSLRVAVVGAGPAACYAVSALARIGGAEINVFERLPSPFGLVRYGVAPDHQRTKGVVDTLKAGLSSPNVKCYFNVEIGRDLTHDELVQRHHAVIYAVGASGSRSLGIPGEEMDGCHTAADVVAWYNGHPDHIDEAIDLTGPRAVVIGNGNVALDVARVLTIGARALADTDIADPALERLAESGIEEVVVLGRRGIADASFSIGEFMALRQLAGVDVVIEGDLGRRPDDNSEGALKYDVAQEVMRESVTPGNKRIVMRFSTASVRIVGEQRVEGLEVTDGEVISAPMVVRAIGYRGNAIPGVPFDATRGIVPNNDGRVVGDDDAPAVGIYATGWIKRGPSGVIGTNRACAEETVTQLMSDHHEGLLKQPNMPTSGIDELLAARAVQVVTWRGWQAIDRAEKANGMSLARPRVKFVQVSDFLSAMTTS